MELSFFFLIPRSIIDSIYFQLKHASPMVRLIIPISTAASKHFIEVPIGFTAKSSVTVNLDVLTL